MRKRTHVVDQQKGLDYFLHVLWVPHVQLKG